MVKLPLYSESPRELLRPKLTVESDGTDVFHVIVAEFPVTPTTFKFVNEMVEEAVVLLDPDCDWELPLLLYVVLWSELF